MEVVEETSEVVGVEGMREVVRGIDPTVRRRRENLSVLRNVRARCDNFFQ